MPAGTRSFSDGFAGTGVPDAAKWYPSYATEAIAGGQLLLEISTTFSAVSTQPVLDISNGEFTIKIDSWGDVDTYTGGSSAECYMPVILISSVASGDTFDLGNAPSSTGNDVGFWITDLGSGVVIVPFYSGPTVGGVTVTAAAEAISGTNHHYLRIRHASGTVYWERSADGSSWTAFTSIGEDSDWDLTRVNINLQTGHY